MDAFIYDVKCKYGEPHHVTPYSDLHWEAEDTDIDAIRNSMRERSQLQNPHFLALGDIADWILPGDRRWSSNVRRKEDAPKTEHLLMDELRAQHKEFGKYPWRIFIEGNHCQTMVKFHHFNPAYEMAKLLGVPFGGVTCFLRFRFWPESEENWRHSFDFLLHHGHWGGRKAKGYLGAMDFGADWQRSGWDMFLFGHNHFKRFDPEANNGPSWNQPLDSEQEWHDYERRKIEYGRKYIIAVGTFKNAYRQADFSRWAERKGVRPAPIGAPLITLTPTRRKLKVVVSEGDV